MISRHEVIIVGAGPAGSSAAYFLAKSGVDTLLLDKAEFPRDKTCGDALSPRTLNMLHQMGVLKDVEDVGKTTDTLRFIAPNSKEITTSLSRIKGNLKKVVILPRYYLDNIMCRAATKQGAKFHGKVKVINIDKDKKEILVVGNCNGREVKYLGKVLIIATGANTKLLSKISLVREQPTVMFAIRCYYENINLLDTSVQFIYDSVPLPGYGWIFPTSGNTANIGVGYFQNRKRSSNVNASYKIFEQFINSSRIKQLLETAKLVGKIKAYPLRIDFPNSITNANNIMVVGEAAGLVNPLTGEGIDNSLESGQIAAEELIDSFSSGNFSFDNYNFRLRKRYAQQFTDFRRIREFFFGNQMALNMFFNAIGKDNKLKSIFLNAIMGYENPKNLVSLNNLWRYIIAI